MNSESELIINKISRATLSLDFTKNKPPDDVVRSAIKSLLVAIAEAIENGEDFQLIFPLTLTIYSETLLYDFMLIAKLENDNASRE